jgi:hypothetical protein
MEYCYEETSCGGRILAPLAGYFLKAGQGDLIGSGIDGGQTSRVGRFSLN